jgi:hypothetical protein
MTKKQPAKSPTKKRVENKPKSKSPITDEELVVIDDGKEMPFKMKEYPDFKKELEFSKKEKERIKKLEDFFSFEKPDVIDMPKLNLDVKAYPNTDEYINIPGSHDTQKWLECVKSIYDSERNGQFREYAIKRVTFGWTPMEVNDFTNWLKFYEEGSHLKYKTAQNKWYESELPGYILPYKKDPIKSDNYVDGKDIDFVRDSAYQEMPKAEKKRIIEKQRNKIIGRLDSTEKLLRSDEGQLLAGTEFETLIEVIYTLKKKLQMVNKQSLSTKLYQDMIVREANVLNKNGFKKAANILYSFADETIPSPAPPVSPALPSGSPGGLPAAIPTVEPTPEGGLDADKDGLDGFINNLETGAITIKDDDASVDDHVIEDELLIEDHEDEMIVQAQNMPVDTIPAPSTNIPDTKPETVPVTETPTEDIEVSDMPNASEDAAQKVRQFDNVMNNAFSNLKIDDVVAKLEDLAKIFKTREVPRQLSIVDMMLDSLGLASFFPSLSEATNKALESNNYISTRVEDILSKLRGSMKTNDIDLKNNNETVSPEITGIKNSLQEQQQKDKEKKEMRKNLADQALENQVNNESKETPDVDIDEDLSAPQQNVAPVKSPTI